MFKFFKKRTRVNFLHIGKTGGSAYKAALRDYLRTPCANIILQGHRISLDKIPSGEKVVFFLRDPVSRFISGFYSRQRKGQPRYNSEWNQREKAAFEKFETPNQLACALADESEAAIEAMKGIQHLKHFSNWYVSLEYFQTRVQDVLFVGFQESLVNDFEKLRSILELPENCSLPKDDFSAHRNPTNLDKHIDERGVMALERWYEEDIRFIKLCEELMGR